MISPNEIKFQNISTPQGLSQSNVYCIIQDRKGFMWFGTEDGLNRFDGYNFIVYKNNRDDKNSLSNSWIRSIFEDSNGKIWIGTHGGGLNCFDRTKEKFTRYFNGPENSKSLSDNWVWSIYEDRAGDLWISTKNGFNKFDKQKKEFTRYKTLPYGIQSGESFIWHIYEDGEGIFWISTKGGLLKFDKENEKFTHYKNDLTNPHSLSNNTVSYVYEDKQGFLWIGTRGGLNRFDRESERFICYDHNPNDPNSLSHNIVRTIHEDSEGLFWIGTYGGGVNIFDKRREKFLNLTYDPKNENCLSSNLVWSFCESREGIIWIGTDSGGINIFDRKKEKFIHYENNPNNKNSLNYNFVRSIFEDRDKILWIGTDGGGLNKFDRKENEFTHFLSDSNDYSSLSNNIVRSIYENEQSLMLIGTYNGLNKFDKKIKKFSHWKHDPNNSKSISNNSITAIYEDSSQNIWIGTESGGINMLNKGSDEFIHYKFDPGNSYSLCDNYVWSICEDHFGTLWIGTQDGLNCALKDSDGKLKFKHFKNSSFDSNSISNNFIWCICKDVKEKNILWIGTAGGLNKLIFDFDERNNTYETVKFITYGINDGLPSEKIYGILQDENGNLWISTSNGLSKMCNVAGKIIFTNYDTQDGLQNNEFNSLAYFKNKEGEMFFGGINGFNSFFPSKIKENEYIPPVILTDFQIFNKSLNVNDVDSLLKENITDTNEIVLAYKHSVFSFEFAALNYTNPQKNLYAFMMDGFDKDWVYSGNRRFVTYTNLDPGEYYFKAKGSNNDGIWNNRGISLRIIITPPFWKRWWFKTFGVIVLGGAIGNVYRNKLIKVKNEKLAQQNFSKQLIESQEKDRKRIASELHDSLGHDLLITKNKLLSSLKDPKIPENIKNQMSEISEIISLSLKGVREISYNLHPYQLDRLGLTKTIQSIIDLVSKSTQIKFISSIDNVDKLLDPQKEINLYRIIQECINNILKHSSASEAILNVIKNEDIISVLISDNGKGFDLNKMGQKQGFGLFSIQERIKLFKGNFSIKSTLDKGTSLNITIPLE